jgi:hypothetical protein
VLRALRETTGVDVPAILAGSALTTTARNPAPAGGRAGQ